LNLSNRWRLEMASKYPVGFCWSAVARGARLRSAALLATTILVAPSLAAAADNVTGGWSSLAKWPLIPIHAVLLSDGRVMTYGTTETGVQTGHTIYDIWDPRMGLKTAAHFTLPNMVGTDLFCNAQLVLPESGEVFMAGGDVWNGQHTLHVGNSDSVLFEPAGNTLSQGDTMNRARFYATVTTLPTGETYIQGGRNGEDQPEIRSADGSFRPLTGINTSALYWWYPRNFVAPDGRIFGISDRAMYFVDPYANGGNGTLTDAGAMPADGPSGTSSSEVMYRPGKILRVGGGGLTNAATEDGKSAAAVIDINGAAPVVTPVTPMPAGLHWHTAIVIADGRVVVTGGSFKSNQLVGVSTHALIWKPPTATTPDSWTVGAKGSGRSRLYHSTALLLPNATVLVGGGGAKGPEKNLNAEIYYPPYLYTASGTLASRPKITAAPTHLTVNQNFTLTINRAASISRVTLIKTGSVTHSFDMEQRFIELTFQLSGSNLIVTAPKSKALAPPGMYLVFVIDVAGVPSIGRFVSL
jgi:hypothetical protein